MASLAPSLVECSPRFWRPTCSGDPLQSTELQSEHVRSSSPQLGPKIGPEGRIVTGGVPPSSRTFFRASAAQKPTQCPFESKNGLLPPSVPAIGTASRQSSQSDVELLRATSSRAEDQRAAVRRERDRSAAHIAVSDIILLLRP